MAEVSQSASIFVACSAAAGPGDASPLHRSTSSGCRQWSGIGLTKGLLVSRWHFWGFKMVQTCSNMFRSKSRLPICFCILAAIGWLHVFDQGLSEARNVASEVLQLAFWWDGSELTIPCIYMHLQYSTNWGVTEHPYTKYFDVVLLPGVSHVDVSLNLACPCMSHVSM